MIALNSKHLSSYEYDQDSKRLLIEFSDGRQYEYSNVPKEVADELGSSPVPGDYFRSVVRTTYHGERVV